MSGRLRGGLAQDGIFTAEATWDPAATAATQGAEVSTTIAVTGARAKDPVVASHSSALGATILVGAVTADNVVTVRIINTTAVAVNVLTGTLRVVVFGNG